MRDRMIITTMKMLHRATLFLCVGSELSLKFAISYPFLIGLPRSASSPLLASLIILRLPELNWQKCADQATSIHHPDIGASLGRLGRAAFLCVLFAASYRTARPDSRDTSFQLRRSSVHTPSLVCYLCPAGGCAGSLSHVIAISGVSA